MKMGRSARRDRTATAGVIASVIIFGILFTVGTSYFIFVNATNNSYVKNLATTAGNLQGAKAETLQVTSLLEANGDIGFYANDTSGVPVNMTVAYVVSSKGAMLHCGGVGLPAAAGCVNTTPPLWMVVNVGRGTPKIDTGYPYVAGTTDVVQVISARGNYYTAAYPPASSNNAVQANTAQSLTVNPQTFKWETIGSSPASLTQSRYSSNCNAAACGLGYTSNVGAGDTLAYALGWYGQNPPSTPTDTLGSTFNLGASSSVVHANSPSLVQNRYTSNCNSANCGLAYTSNIASGNTLVFGLGWYGQSPPSSPTDTRGDSFTAGATQSVTYTPPSPALVQSRYTSNCNSANCGLAYTSPVTAGNTLVLGLGWYGRAPPATPTDTRGNTFSLGISNSVASGYFTPSVVQQRYTSNCNAVNCGLGYSSPVTGGNTLVYGLGWSSGGQTYVPITLTNNQGTATPNPFQQQLTWNPSTYSSYEASDLGNIRFCADSACATTLNAWLESCTSSCAPSATSATAWVKLTSAITGSGGTLTIYMVFQATNVEFDANYWGEAPNLSGTYGQYDNGANVFSAYFNGNTATSSFSLYSGYSLAKATGVTYGAGTISALQLTGYNGNTPTMVYSTAMSNAAAVTESNFEQNHPSTDMGTTGFVNNAAASSVNNGISTNMGYNSKYFDQDYDVGGTVTVDVNQQGTSATAWLYSSTTYLGSSASTYTSYIAPQLYSTTGGYSGTASVNPISSASNIYLGFIGSSSSSYPTNIYFNWDRARAYPPSNVIPSASFGSPTGGNSPPSTPTDTLGDAYTLGASNSVPVAGSSPSVVQKAYTSNCNASNCGLAYTSSVTAGNILAYGVGWTGQSPPSTPTDTRSNTFSLGASNSVSVNPSLSLVQKKFTANCASSNCGATFTNPVTAGDTLAFGLGWATQSPPSTPTDTLGNTYTLGVSNTVGSALALDGSGTGSGQSASSYTISLTTSNANDVLYLSSVNGQSATVSSVTSSPSLTWTHRASVTYSTVASPSNDLETWYAIWSSSGSITITVNLSTSVNAAGVAYGISGANTASPFDGNGAIPATNNGDAGTSSSVTLSTSNANDFIIGAVGLTGTPSLTVGSGTTLVGTQAVSTFRETSDEYKIVSSTQSNLQLSYSWSGSQDWGMIGDAIKASTASTYYSYIWYTTTGSSGTDAISASFGSSVTGAVSMYELSGYTTAGYQTSTKSSAAGSTTASVNSFTPASNSIVIGNAESASTTYSVGSGYTLAGTCNSVSGCGEYQTGVGSATTVPFTLNPSAEWVEAAISFAPAPATTYYSYIWYTLNGSAGADTITASFGSAVAGAVSIYEISGATLTGYQSQTGSSSGGSTTAAVGSFTPSTNSIVIGNAESGSPADAYTAGAGYNLVGTCSSVTGCSEYQTGVGSATTVPFTLNPSSPWVEAALSFAPPSTTYYSYIWYATAGASGSDTITATFGSTVAGTVSIYEVYGITATGLQTSTGSSTGSAATSVTSFTPATNSFVLGNVETASSATKYTVGTGYSSVATGGSGCDASDAAQGCNEYKVGGGSATTVPFTLSASAGWVETAMSFAPAPVVYYSYIWYANTGSSGADTITASFVSAVTGSVSIYEVAGYSTSGALSSTGSSTGSTSAAVTSFTPATNSFVLGNVETASSATTYTVGSGYTTVATGASGCDVSDAAQGCNEYETGLGSATTTPFTLSASTAWSEAAMSFAPATPVTYYSYIWYTTAASSGPDTISATFSQAVTGSVSIYEINGVTTTSPVTSTGSSATSQSGSSVTSMTPGLNSVVIGNVEGASTTTTAGSGYTLDAACSSVYGCSEYQSLVGSTTTVPTSFSPSVPWVEAAIALAPPAVTYYSYIWYAAAGASGADTITATFGSSVTGSVSIYELSGYSTTGITTGTGSSSGGSTGASVTSFTPGLNSIVIGNIETSSTTITAGSGFTLPNTCSSVYGCSEYQTGVSSSTTAPMTLNPSAPWVEAGIAFRAAPALQNGQNVGGYPAMGIPYNTYMIWQVQFTNQDSQGRSVTLWPKSLAGLKSIIQETVEITPFFIIDGLTTDGSTEIAYNTTQNFITIPYKSSATVYFGAFSPRGTTPDKFDTSNEIAPFTAFFALEGIYSDQTLFGLTVPYPAGMVTQANAKSTPTVGANGVTVTMSCNSPCNFIANAKSYIGWFDSTGHLTTMKTFTMDGSGNIPSGITFAVPTAPVGFYTIVVSDYINTYFVTFQHV